MIGRKGLASKLKSLREEVELDQETVAKILDIPRSAVSAIESSTREVSAFELLELCKVYRVAPNDMLNWPKYKTREVKP